MKKTKKRKIRKKIKNKITETMGLVEALRSWKKFKRKYEDESRWRPAWDGIRFPDSDGRVFTVGEILSQDWIVQRIEDIPSESPRVFLWEWQRPSCKEWVLEKSFMTEQSAKEWFKDKFEYRKSRMSPPEGWPNE